MTTPPAPSTVPSPANRRRHLMDPANPRPRAPQTSTNSMSVGQVQKWILSALVVTTLMHLAGGLVIAAIFLDDAKVAGRIGLNVIAGLVGTMGIAAARGIHQKSLVSPWLLIGLLPTAVGLYLTF